MKVLVACEFSGIVRDAFRLRGHDAWSCDLLQCEADDRYHIRRDVLDIINEPWWDLMIAHPPCQYLAVSGARWKYEKPGWAKSQDMAAAFFLAMIDAPMPMIAVGNPVGIMSTRYRKPDQYIQPWQYGHGEVMKTGLWLKGLPRLIPTNIVDGREARVWREPPGPERTKNRSRFFPGIADAMASQWAVEE